MLVREQIEAFEKEMNQQMHTAGSAACNSRTEPEGKNRRYWNIGVNGKINVTTFLHIRDELRKVGWQVLELVDHGADRYSFRIAVL
jgi:hypothetical protein